MLIYVNQTLSVRVRELKNKGKVQLGNSKSGRFQELFITEFKAQFKQGFTKVFVTGAGRSLQ